MSHLCLVAKQMQKLKSGIILIQNLRTKMCNIQALAVLLCFVSGIDSETNLYMDSPTACGQQFPAGQNQIFYLGPRSLVSVANPPTNCVVYFMSSFTSNAYKFQITVEAAQFRDCGMTLNIYDGPTTSDTFIRSLGCGTSATTGNFYSKDRTVTVQLTRLKVDYYFGNDFKLKVQLYHDTTAADEYIGTYKFTAGAIIGIVLGVIAVIAAAVLLAWCYKTGRIPGVDQYPNTATKSSLENLSKSDFDEDKSMNTWHNTKSESKLSNNRSNFDLDDAQVWSSLTNLNPSKPFGANKNQNAARPPAGKGTNSRGAYKVPNNERNFKSLQQPEQNQLSKSPGTWARSQRLDSQGRFAGDDKISNTVRSGKGDSNGPDNKKTLPSVSVKPDNVVNLDDNENVQKQAGDNADAMKMKKTQDLQTEFQEAIQRNNVKRQQSKNATDASENQSFDGHSSQSDISNIANTVTDSERMGSEAHSSPKTVKEMQKHSKEKQSLKLSRKDDNAADAKNPNNNTSAPPEAYAPIFANEEEASTDLLSQQYQPGYQGNFPPAAPFDPRYPMGPYAPQGMPPGMYASMPFQQTGQAPWYVEGTPNGDHKMAFAMTTHNHSDDDILVYTGEPYTSTPYYSNVHDPGNSKSMVAAGTILDDPQVPPLGMNVVRYADDPLTGTKTSQVIWSGLHKDPTDPPPDSASQVTRKTVTRITACSTKDDLPGVFTPNLQEMSLRTATHIQMSGQEPAFMGPTRGAQYYPTNSIQPPSHTPSIIRQLNSAATPVQTTPDHHHHHAPSASTPQVIREAPMANKAFKERIVLNYDNI